MLVNFLQGENVVGECNVWRTGPMVFESQKFGLGVGNVISHLLSKAERI
jgi:hypothetical protein